MKKILSTAIILSLTLALPVMADSLEDTSSGGNVEDLYKYVPTVENAFQGQKQITDEDFNKTYNKIKAKQDKKKKINQPFKGNNVDNNDGGQYIKDTAGESM